jgi:hypothetical protein
MTCENQCHDGQCPHPELCASYDEAHSILILVAWLCIVVLMLFCWVCTVIYSGQSGAALSGLVEAAKNIF